MDSHLLAQFWLFALVFEKHKIKSDQRRIPGGARGAIAPPEFFKESATGSYPIVNNY